MCGIAGVWFKKSLPSEQVLHEEIARMTNSLRHRGPDAGGVWLNPKRGLALGHRRLAIRDLSAAGHQPMVSPCENFALSYNGEIYNADELRSELIAKGISFNGSSDTEVLLYACIVWGVERAVSRLIGMFAFAFWDRANEKLTLIRDRMGIKPLYWGEFNGVFFFASELKALRQFSGWSPSVNRHALTGYMRYSFIPAPLSIYNGVQTLHPGMILEITPDNGLKFNQYWNAKEVLAKGQKNRLTGAPHEIIHDLELLLKDSVKRRMVADVPLGAFLSGGIDSSLIVALMQDQHYEPIRTFSIGFEEKQYDEAPYARAIADHLGTNHTEQYMTMREAWEALPNIPKLYDEPFADSSQLPTYLLSAITKQHVTISLSGDGGDELFGGYTRYFQFFEALHRLHKLPSWYKNAFKSVTTMLAPTTWDRLASFIPSRFRPHSFGTRLHQLADRLCCNPMKLYRGQMTHWQQPEILVHGGQEPLTPFDDLSLLKSIPDHFERMQFIDSISYLPDDILVKVDRASMGVALETRVPLLDHRVVDFAWQLPYSLRTQLGKGKWALREILSQYIPSHLYERPKMGFGVPIDIWLRGPLRDWAEELLDPKRIGNEGFLNASMVQGYWCRHLDGENWQYPLWDVLMFQAWLDEHLKSAPAPSVVDDLLVAVVSN